MLYVCVCAELLHALAFSTCPPPSPRCTGGTQAVLQRVRDYDNHPLVTMGNVPKEAFNYNVIEVNILQVASLPYNSRPQNNNKLTHLGPVGRYALYFVQRHLASSGLSTKHIWVSMRAKLDAGTLKVVQQPCTCAVNRGVWLCLQVSCSLVVFHGCTFCVTASWSL